MQTITARSTRSKEKLRQHRSILKRLGIIFCLAAIVIGLITRVIAVFQYITFDIGPDPDQIRDAFVVMKMWQGELPSFGPVAFGSGLGGFRIFPLYYYLIFPFTVLGSTPALQALPNALFSFLSIPLFIYLTYQLLDNVPSSKRIFLSGLAGFWYSLLFGDIFISNFQWNPSSIPFFFMLFTAVYNSQMKTLSSGKKQLVLWLSNGLILAILMSLHASTLFIMPIVYSILSVTFMFKVLKTKGLSGQLWFPGAGILAAAIALLPYWISETQGPLFSNTRAIINTIRSSPGESSDAFFLSALIQRIGNAVLHALDIVRQAYFWSASSTYLILSALAIALITSIALTQFRGNQHIWLMWLSTWGLALLAVASLNPGETVFYYKILLLAAPIILTIVALAYGKHSGRLSIICRVIIAAFITLSCANNLYRDTQFMAAKYGPNRIMNTREVVEVMAQLPKGARICDPRIERKRETLNQYHYIDTYLTKKGIEAVSNCQKGNFLIHPKRILAIPGNFLNASDYQSIYAIALYPANTLDLWPVLSTVKNSPINIPADSASATPIIETQTAYVYRLD